MALSHRNQTAKGRSRRPGRSLALITTVVACVLTVRRLKEEASR